MSDVLPILPLQSPVGGLPIRPQSFLQGRALAGGTIWKRQRLTVNTLTSKVSPTSQSDTFPNLPTSSSELWTKPNVPGATSTNSLHARCPSLALQPKLKVCVA